ncbi:MAG: metal-dependent transcriptional regulator [Acidobacteriota bacterium]
MPTSTVEDYLKRILLEEQARPGQRVSTGAIAAALDVAPASVTAMIKTLDGSGLVSYEPYSGVSLTDAGRQLALHVLRRHRLVELFLVRVMGIDWARVHAEAELLEHAVSDRLIRRMDEMLGFPDVDPHGDPIPTALGEVQERARMTLLSGPVGQLLEVVRVGNQTVDFLQLIEREGLKPGQHVTILERDEAADRVWLAREGRSDFSLGYRAASKIFVGRPVGVSATSPASELEPEERDDG